MGHADALRQLKGLALAELVLLRLCVSVTVPHADPVLLRLCVRDTVGLPEKQAKVEALAERKGLVLTVPLSAGEAEETELVEIDAQPLCDAVWLPLGVADMVAVNIEGATAWASEGAEELEPLKAPVAQALDLPETLPVRLSDSDTVLVIH